MASWLETVIYVAPVSKLEVVHGFGFFGVSGWVEGFEGFLLFYLAHRCERDAASLSRPCTLDNAFWSAASASWRRSSPLLSATFGSR